MVLGLRIGITQSSASSRMNHYEKDRHIPDMQTISKLAEELDVPVAFFFCENDDMAELVTLFSKLSPKQRAEYLEKIKDLNLSVK